MGKSYRLGFVLTVAAGNRTRLEILRKYASRDAEVECVWAPIKHYLEPDPFWWMPDALRMRVEIMWEARPVFEQFGSLDAVMFHALEPYVAGVLATVAPRSPLVVWSQDNPPSPDPKISYSGSKVRPPWRRNLRFRFDCLCAQRVALFLPFSEWAADMLERECGIDRARIEPVHVGVDLEVWHRRPAPQNARPKILFVGGNFVRKGGDLLLDIWRESFAQRAELHLVTKEPPGDLPPSAFVYTDLDQSSPRLKELYAEADVFVVPTRADLSSFVAMEAMATGRPVVTTHVGGIPDIVVEGETGFLVAPDDRIALHARIAELLDSGALRERMGARGREVVETKFDAARNVPRMLGRIKTAIDARRAGAAVRAV